MNKRNRSQRKWYRHCARKNNSARKVEKQADKVVPPPDPVNIPPDVEDSICEEDAISIHASDGEF